MYVQQLHNRTTTAHVCMRVYSRPTSTSMGDGHVSRKRPAGIERLAGWVAGWRARTTLSHPSYTDKKEENRE